MTEPTPTQQAQDDARKALALIEKVLAAAIARYAEATQRRFEEEGTLPEGGDDWLDLGRFGKGRP